MKNVIIKQQEKLRLSFSGCKKDNSDNGSTRLRGSIRGYDRKKVRENVTKNVKEASYKF